MKSLGENIEYFNELLAQVFERGDNYLIEATPAKASSNKPICAIYFTSADVYDKPTPKAFSERIVCKNHYEWYNTRVVSATKHIFIRDIKRCWYQSGINSRLKSIDDVAEFLRKETQGCEVITIGSSMGGYASLVFAGLLQAKKCMAFSPCFNLKGVAVNDGKYSDIVSLYKDNDTTEVFAYFPIESEFDRPQAKLAEEMPGVYRMLHDHNQHGISFSQPFVHKLINMESEELKKLYCGKVLSTDQIAKMYSLKPSEVGGIKRPKIKTEFDVRNLKLVDRIEYKICKHFIKSLARKGIGVK